MINLFKRVYISYDFDLRSAKGQKRLFVTNRRMPYPITTDPLTRKDLGILDHYHDVDEFLHAKGGAVKVIEELFSNEDKVCLITTHELATLLQLSVFKSIMKNPTVEAAYILYRSTYMHQKAASLQTLQSFENSAQFIGQFPSLMTLDEFQIVYDRAETCSALKEIGPWDVPIEYLLANYLANPEVMVGGVAIFFSKFRQIALENAIFRIRVLRNEILTNSMAASRYLGREIDEIHALEELVAHPATAWLQDETLSLYNSEDAVAKFSIPQLLEIYDSIEELLQISIEERAVLEFISRGDIYGLLRKDMEDERGNFIGTEQYVSKVNGVFINKCYQEGRKENTAFFQQFKLRPFKGFPI